MVVQTFNPGTQEQKQVNLCELEARIVYTEGFRTARAT